jgi:2-hydroxycyclohexanecarboxyl-CoA dehydrogenase
MTEASPSMRFAQKNVLVTGAAKVRREWEATPMNRFVEPQEVASVMLFLCSADASAMTGQAINVTGGFIMT